jgi:hypothetical protein
MQCASQSERDRDCYGRRHIIFMKKGERERENEKESFNVTQNPK